MVMDQRLLLASCVADPLTVSNPDMKELLSNNKAWESWESHRSNLTKHFLKFIANLLCIKKLNLKVNSKIKSFISSHSRTGFKIHFLLNMFSQYTVLCKVMQYIHIIYCI